ncbi:SCO6745 family protein, partial [Nocardia sp. NPDC003345]
MSTALPAYARQVWTLLEPLHAVTYFAPEPLHAFKAAGYRGFWMGYFAGRGAPLGPTGPEVVHALFYNFTLDRIAKALPSAWEFAPPAAALDARAHGSAAALRRHFGDLAESPGLATAADLAS